MSRKAGVTEYPCGCSHDVHRWLALCEKHEAEWQATHAEWRADHKASRLAVAVAVAVALTGCGVLPDTAGAYLTHSSVPFAGVGPGPIGNHSANRETTYEALRGSLTWERGGWTIASDVDIVMHSTHLDARTGVIWSARVGREIELNW